MIERRIQAVAVDDAGSEDPARTRERLTALFPRGATRRMTQLGLLLGSVLDRVPPGEDDPVIYASSYGETRALEAYLAGFPSASPMLFQTSIHPSAVQQVLIARQQPVRELFPLAGLTQIAAVAARAALLAPGNRAILCGGEELAAGMLRYSAGSPSAFAFALALSQDADGAVGSLGLEPVDAADGELSLADFFAALRDRRPLRAIAAPGLRLVLSWF